MTHRETIKDFLAQLVYKNKKIIDWGSGSKPVSRYIQHENCKFITIDNNKLIAADRRSVNHIIHDIQEPIELDAADVAFCMEVLEHTQYPHQVLDNIWHNLKEGGHFYFSMPYNFRVHSYDDYMRLTENGIRAYFEQAGFRIELFMATVGDEGFIVKATK